MLAVIVQFHLRPAFMDAFTAAIVDNARASRLSEPGCRQFDVCRDPAAPQLFFLYELYDDEEAFQVHLATSHFKAMDELTAAWVERKTVWRYQRISP